MYWTEALGYSASLFIIVSLMMSKIWPLRWFNLIGCIAFTLYGLMIHAYPVALLNGIAALANVFHLIKIIRNKSEFTLLKVNTDDPLLLLFAHQHDEKIKKHAPNWNQKCLKTSENYLVLQPEHFSVCGLFSYQQHQKEAAITLDFLSDNYASTRFESALYRSIASTMKSKVHALFVEKDTVSDPDKYIRLGFLANDKKKLILSFD